METGSNKLENRVLIFMPTGRDGLLVSSVLDRSAITAVACDSYEKLIEELSFGGGAVLIAEEALDERAISHLIGSLEGQPIWSDLPVILFSSSSRNAETLLRTLGSRINATVVERPIRITMLVSAVRGALRARQRQYQTRDLLRQLEEADRQKDLFLATLSHELRTPLNSILGWIQILRGRESDHVDVQHALDVIERNARAQSEMIADILFVSRVITGKLELNLESVTVSELVGEAIDIVSPSARSKNISLDFDGGGELFLDADPDRLRQVFLNLLSNAVKFTPDGGRVDVRMRKKGGTAEIEFCDSGDGIDPGFLPHIFERFRQADNTYTRSVGGLGLGLAIVRYLVELHGGSVRAESDGPGCGSKFYVSLPIAAPEKAPRGENLLIDSMPTTEPKPENPLAGVRILVVEDDHDSREMMSTFLSFRGAEIAIASSAREALDRIDDFQPHVLISDIGLPEQDGYDLIRKVRQRPSGGGGDMPAVALTGYVSLHDRTAALAAGYQEHLPKPVDTEKLVELVAGLVSDRAFSNARN